MGKRGRRLQHAPASASPCLLGAQQTQKCAEPHLAGVASRAASSRARRRPRGTAAISSAARPWWVSEGAQGALLAQQPVVCAWEQRRAGRKQKAQGSFDRPRHRPGRHACQVSRRSNSNLAPRASGLAPARTSLNTFSQCKTSAAGPSAADWRLASGRLARWAGAPPGAGAREVAAGAPALPRACHTSWRATPGAWHQLRLFL